MATLLRYASAHETARAVKDHLCEQGHHMTRVRAYQFQRPGSSP